MVAIVLNTNVVVTLLSADSETDVQRAQHALEESNTRGELLISPVVYSELLAAPRRILADFLTSAHATELGVRLLTFDTGIYRAAFPNLTVIALPTR